MNVNDGGPASDPRMKSCSVTLRYSADDGFSSSAVYSSKRAGSPGKCWIAVADEVARLAELFGLGDEVEAAVKDARQRVRDWRNARGAQ